MITRHHQKGDAASVATYSACQTYRYSLTRTWAPDLPRALFILLNPSTASEVQNDPTIERCERRARALGFGALQVTNLFAFRATDPAQMQAAADPVGPDNDDALRDALPWADLVLCGWGNHGAHQNRAAQVTAMLHGTGRPLHHLGLTAQGQPTHPLYIPYSRPPQPWT